jgi:hypothetical protein
MANSYLDTDVLKDLRDHTRSFLKLDFAYLATAGAIITTLKIARSELVDFGANLKLVVFILLAIALFDVLVNSLIFRDWFAARSGVGKRYSVKLLFGLLNTQPFIHLVFVGGLLSFATGFSSGYYDARERIKGRVLFQEQVELYMLKNGSPPNSIA